jgi:hypothetical protein
MDLNIQINMLIVGRDIVKLDVSARYCLGTLVILSDSKWEASAATLANFDRVVYLEAPGKGLIAFLNGYIQGTNDQLNRLGRLATLAALNEKVYYLCLRRPKTELAAEIIFPDEDQISEDEDSSS